VNIAPISQLASQVGDRSQAANRQVAAQCIALPEHRQEIVAALHSTNVALRGDCLEVLKWKGERTCESCG
jgi:hypothetical protein